MRFPRAPPLDGRLARQHGFVKFRVIRQRAVDWHAFAASYEQPVTGNEGLDGNGTPFAVLEPGCLPRRASEQRGHLALRAVLRIPLQRPAACQHQGNDRGSQGLVERDRQTDREPREHIDAGLPPRHGPANGYRQREQDRQRTQQPDDARERRQAERDARASCSERDGRQNQQRKIDRPGNARHDDCSDRRA